MANSIVIALQVNMRGATKVDELNKSLLGLRKTVAGMGRGLGGATSNMASTANATTKAYSAAAAAARAAGTAGTRAQRDLIRITRQQNRELERQHEFWDRIEHDMRTVAGRMRQIQPVYDAVFRAGYRMQEVGRDMMQIGQRMISTMAGMTQEFGEFEFMVNRATGAMGLNHDATEQGVSIYGRFQSRIMQTARELRLFNPTDVAKATYFWASATGQQVDSLSEMESVLKNVTPLMKVAAMTQTDYETAIKGVYAITIQYGMRLSDVGRVTEKLHQVTQRTAAEFPDLINSFKMVGPVAAANSVTFEDVANVLGRLADAGIRGTMSGRGLRQFFIQTVRPSAIAKAALDDLWASTPAFMGKTFEEMIFPRGTFGGIDKYVGHLATALQHATQAQRNFYLARITTANELPILTALVTKEIDVLNGVSEGWDKTKEASQEAAEGFASSWQKLADSWLGTVGAVQRGIESLRIMIGGRIAKVLTPVMEAFADALDRMISWVEDPRNQDIIEFFSAATAAVAGFLTVGGGLMLFVGSLTNLGAAIMVIARVFGPLILKATVLAGGIAALGAAFVDNANYIIDAGRKIGRNINEAFGGGEGAVNGLTDAFSSFGRLIVPLFGVVVRRAADLAVALSELFKILMSFGPTAGILQGLFSVMGLAFGVKMVANVLGLGTALGHLAGAFKKLQFAQLAWSTAPSGSFIGQMKSAPSIVGKTTVAVRGLAVAMRGLMSATGVGLIFVGLLTAYEAIPPFRDAVDGLFDMIIDKAPAAKARVDELVASFEQGPQVEKWLNASIVGQQLERAAREIEAKGNALHKGSLRAMQGWSAQTLEDARIAQSDFVADYMTQAQKIIDSYSEYGTVSVDRFWAKVFDISRTQKVGPQQALVLTKKYFDGVTGAIDEASAKAEKMMDQFRSNTGQGMIPGKGWTVGKDFSKYLLAQLVGMKGSVSPMIAAQIEELLSEAGGEGVIAGLEDISDTAAQEAPKMWAGVASTLVNSAKEIRGINKRIRETIEEAVNPSSVGRSLAKAMNKWIAQGFKDEKGRFVPEAVMVMQGDLQQFTENIQHYADTMSPADFEELVRKQIKRFTETSNKHWDKMPPSLQQTLLDSVKTLYGYLGEEEIPPEVLAKMTGEGRKGGKGAGKGTIEGVQSQTGNVKKAVANMYSTAERSMKFGRKPFNEGASVPKKTASGMDSQKRTLSSAVSRIVSRITGINLSSKSYSWGAHLLRNLAAGIRNNIILVQKAARRAAGVIAGPLEHSVPKYGPLADDDVWGEHFINNIANAMDKKLPALRAKAMEVAEAMKVEQQAAYNNGVTFETSARKTIKVQVEVTSPDGSVDRVKASQLENALITNDLILAIEHMSTVG